MPRTPLQFQQIKDERKLSILEASLSLFALYTKNEVSIDLISAKAKCSHGLVYHYFKNVDEVYNELLKSKTYLDLQKSIIETKENLSSYERLLEISQKLLQISNKSKEYVAFAVIMISDDSKNSLQKLMCKLISEGQKNGDILAGKPEEVFACFSNFLNGIYLPILLRRHPNTKIPAFENVIQIFKRRKF